MGEGCLCSATATYYTTIICTDSVDVHIPYLLNQTPWLLFISSPKFVRHLFIPVAAREAILREMVN